MNKIPSTYTYPWECYYTNNTRIQKNIAAVNKRGFIMDRRSVMSDRSAIVDSRSTKSVGTVNDITKGGVTLFDSIGTSYMPVVFGGPHIPKDITFDNPNLNSPDNHYSLSEMQLFTKAKFR